MAKPFGCCCCARRSADCGCCCSSVAACISIGRGGGGVVADVLQIIQLCRIASRNHYVRTRLACGSMVCVLEVNSSGCALHKGQQRANRIGFVEMNSRRSKGTRLFAIRRNVVVVGGWRIMRALSFVNTCLYCLHSLCVGWLCGSGSTLDTRDNVARRREFTSLHCTALHWGMCVKSCGAA